jgi:hypothetical protein
MNKKIQNNLINKPDDYLFNILEIDNFNKKTSNLRDFYKYIIENDKKVNGDIFEFGCYKGRSLLALALLLKKIKSKKILYAFDSFKGFPIYTEKDSFKNLKYRKDVYDKHLISKEIRNFFLKEKVNKKNISGSLDFSFNSKKMLEKKINFLGLNNIKIVQGNFNKTVPYFFSKYKNKIFGINLDSDLYDSYRIVLENTYPYLMKNGYVHLDEYYSIKFPGAKIAVDEFCKKNHIVVRKNKNYVWEFERFYLKK